MSLKNLPIDKSWTLFLDRDGVINTRLENDYVKHWVEFEFMEGTLDALKVLAAIFGHIVVVTNQQGVAKGLYRREDLELIHGNMLYEIAFYGGRIDKVYFAPQLAADKHPDRKPGIGMALKAKQDHPGIDFSKSVMVGDSMSDMEFGRKAGMKTVFIGSDKIEHPDIDWHFTSLIEFALTLQH